MKTFREFVNVKRKICGKNQGISPGRPKSMKTLDVRKCHYFNQGKRFVIRENSGKNQGILFSILAGYPALASDTSR
jgi:hypothetical protein